MPGSRAVASPTITWGLVSVPCKAYLAASSENFSFNLLSPNKNRINMQFVDAVTKEPVDKKDCTKVYEHTKDQYIEFTEEELKALDGDKNNYIEITEVSDVSLSAEMIEKAYYLTPDKSDKSYRLLVKCLIDMQSVAIAKFYTRGRDHLVALIPAGDVLMMLQLYYANELREMSHNFLKNTEPSEKEIELGKMLMAQLKKDVFDLNAYRDEYSARVAMMIEKKQNGEQIEMPKQEIKGNGFDLAALLENSLKGKTA